MSLKTHHDAPQLLEELEEMVRDCDEIPTIPESLLQIMKVLDDRDSGPSDLANVVRLDAPLMAKILRVANSPFYKNSGSISDINRCVAVLGYRTVRQMTLMISVATSVVAAVAEAGGMLDYRELWRHSVITGAMGKELARWTGYADPEEIFTTGLLHDIGKFILEIRDAERYDSLILARRASGRPLVELEREEFGFDHAQIGAAFGNVWTLPRRMTLAVASHHAHDPGSLPERDQQAVSLVRLADYLANTMSPLRSDLGFDPGAVDPRRLTADAGLEFSVLDERLPDLRAAVELASDYLDLDTPA